MVRIRILSVIFAAAVAVLALAAPARAEAPGVAAGGASIPGARLWLEVEAPEGRDPFVQEMVLVRVRGSFTVPIALYKLEPPPLPGFRWQRIGRDAWAEAVDDGLQVRGFLATFALFPQHSGALPIGPFVDHLTVVDDAGERVAVDISTAATTLTAAPAPAANRWWLPARNLTVTEAWSVDPKDLAVGQSTRRTITISAEGVTDDQLPPPPAFASPKLIAFADPPVRRTAIAVGAATELGERRRQSMPRPGRLQEVAGRDGPVASVTYAWTVRPTTDEPVTVPAVEIPWFDTDSGRPALAMLPPRTVAVALLGQSAAELERRLGIAAAAPAPPDGRLERLAAAAAFLAGFGATLAAAAAAVGVDVPRRLRAAEARRRALRALAAAAGRGDAAAMWAGLEGLRAAEAAGGRHLAAAAAEADLVAAMFAGPTPDLPAARAAVAALRGR